MSAADVAAIRGDLGRLLQTLTSGHFNTVFNPTTHPWLDDEGTYLLPKIASESRLRDVAILAAVQGLDTTAVLNRINEKTAELVSAVAQVDENVIAAIPGRTDGDIVRLLTELLGEDRAEQVAHLILGEQPA